jgi:23S rRNA pseudouridine2605 synthase
MVGRRNGAPSGDGDRLQKILAAAGVASRRAAEDMIAEGRVTVNGDTALVGQRAHPGRDEIVVDGRVIELPGEKLYVALHKPTGFVTSLASTHGEQTVMEFMETSHRVNPVGRLDKDTSGLLLFTDDGDWANLVTHPRYGIQKEYEVTVHGKVSDGALLQLQRGAPLPDGTKTSPATVSMVSQTASATTLLVTLVEGKKRQIRLMFAAVGHAVELLRRERIGTVRLGTLDEGQSRVLSLHEVQGIRELAARGVNERGAKAVDRDRRPRSRR